MLEQENKRFSKVQWEKKLKTLLPKWKNWERSLGSQDQGHTTIRKEYDKFFNFIKGGNDSLSNLRRETMFINIISGLHPFESEILLLCKDKKLETKYKIEKKHIAQAYPEITWRDGFTL